MHPADPDDVHHQVGVQLRALLRLAPSVHARLAHDIGIGVTDALALDNAMAGDLGVSELAQRLGIRSASATVAVDRLVASGHMQRSPHPTDGRRTRLQPTETAYADAWRAAGPLVTAIRDVAGRLDDESAEIVRTFLGEAIDALYAFADEDTAASDEDERDDLDGSEPDQDDDQAPRDALTAERRRDPSTSR